MSHLSGCGAIAQKCKTVPPGSDKFGNSTGVSDMPQMLIDTDILIDVANNDAIAKVRLTDES